MVSALIAGAGLAVAGSMLQRLFRNPLASPTPSASPAGPPSAPS
ncbi:iron chelate uptake ABC transporter family permease subunit [Kitasatospora aburaviensis]